MSGYGSVDSDSELASQMAENGIEAHRQVLKGRVLTKCQDCGEDINPLRVEALRKNNMKCEYCITCQEHHNGISIPQMLIKML